ncbi:conserved hypothetical protein [Rhodococcus sp. RD6.2]|jgi:hypothetical protein|uniref:hypothetical protein n=1 Tax=Rhodococcus sp. RD6.2 TaxID=260936 RepID=UPI00063B96C7|nr:hypothetical protein [Rhodococcus sp. RD6.2]CRK51723.1 conserved hypothetical protein [Rhodococcus sp. RD6.2]
MSEDTAAALQARVHGALALFVDIAETTDGSLGFEYAGALCSMRAVNLAPGLDVLSLTAVLAWDRPVSTTLHRKVAAKNDALQFGLVSVITRGRLADVILRYTFPAAGLTDEALTTMLLLVLAGVEDSRQGLLG